MPSLEQIRKDLRRVNDRLDGISDELVNQLEAYQVAYERELRKLNLDTKGGKLKNVLKNYAKVESFNAFQRLGFSQIALDYVKQYSDVAKLGESFHKAIGIEANIDYEDVRVLKQLRKIDRESMLGEGLTLDRLVKHELVNAIALKAPLNATITNLAANLLGAGEKTGRLARYANTYMRTSLFGLSRDIDKEIYDKVGYQKFRYVGALDKKTRPFCQKRVGKIFTRKQIERFPVLNGSGLNGFFSPGGWSCRHRLIPVATEKV